MSHPQRVTASPSRVLRRACSLMALALAVPAVAGAQSPSSEPSGGVSPTESPIRAVPVSDDDALLPEPVDLGGRIGAVLGMPVTLEGVLPGAAGRTVRVQRRDPRRGWVTVAETVGGPGGAFDAVWDVDRVGLFATRAVLSGPAAIQASSEQLALTPVTGYRAARATYFGPGLFGRRTACGQRLTRRLRGIAHRKLPCGTVVELVYGGKIVRAPVVDRGPFHRGIRYDLTQATARELGFDSTDTVGAAAVAEAPDQDSR